MNTGLTPGSDYTVHFRANSQNATTPTLRLSRDGINLLGVGLSHGFRATTDQNKQIRGRSESVGKFMVGAGADGVLSLPGSAAAAGANAGSGNTPAGSRRSQSRAPTKTYCNFSGI